jgi:hypothetical protein
MDNFQPSLNRFRHAPGKRLFVERQTLGMAGADNAQRCPKGDVAGCGIIKMAASANACPPPASTTAIVHPANIRPIGPIRPLATIERWTQELRVDTLWQ